MKSTLTQQQLFKITHTSGGNKVRKLLLKPIPQKSNANPKYIIEGEILRYDELVKVMAWLSHTWDVDGKDYFEGNEQFCLSLDGAQKNNDSQLNLFQ